MSTKQCANPVCRAVLPVTEFTLRPGLRRDPLCNTCRSAKLYRYNHHDHQARKTANSKASSIFADMGL